jgi:predicted HD phosphohydrolase
MGLVGMQAVPRCTIAQMETSLSGASLAEDEGSQETPALLVLTRDVGPLLVRKGDVILADHHKDGGDPATGPEAGWLRCM